MQSLKKKSAKGLCEATCTFLCSGAMRLLFINGGDIYVCDIRGINVSLYV